MIKNLILLFNLIVLVGCSSNDKVVNNPITGEKNIPGVFLSPVIGLLTTLSLFEHPTRTIKLNSNIKFLIMTINLLLSCLNVLPEFNKTSND